MEYLIAKLLGDFERAELALPWQIIPGNLNNSVSGHFLRAFVHRLSFGTRGFAVGILHGCLS